MTFGAVPDFAYNTGASASEDTGESDVEQQQNGETLVVTAQVQEVHGPCGKK